MSERQRLRQCLQERPWTLKELAEVLELPLRTVEEHLRHVQKSLKREGLRLTVRPARCRRCGFTFTHGRLTRPGRCPRCRGTWIEAPRVSIETDKGTQAHKAGGGTTSSGGASSST